MRTREGLLLRCGSRWGLRSYEQNKEPQYCRAGYGAEQGQPIVGADLEAGDPKSNQAVSPGSRPEQLLPAEPPLQPTLSVFYKDAGSAVAQSPMTSLFAATAGQSWKHSGNPE